MSLISITALHGKSFEASQLPLQASLNSFMALGRPAWREARASLLRLLSKDEGALRDNAAVRQEAIIPTVSAPPPEAAC